MNYGAEYWADDCHPFELQLRALIVYGVHLPCEPWTSLKNYSALCEALDQHNSASPSLSCPSHNQHDPMPSGAVAPGSDPVLEPVPPLRQKRPRPDVQPSTSEATLTDEGRPLKTSRTTALPPAPEPRWAPLRTIRPVKQRTPPDFASRGPTLTSTCSSCHPASPTGRQ